MTTTNDNVPVQQQSMVPVDNRLGEGVRDEVVRDLWIHGRAESTKRAYEADAKMFFEWVQKPMAQVSLGDLQRYGDSLTGARESRRRRTAVVKSLFRFAAQLGYIHFDPTRAWRGPKRVSAIANRILTAEDIQAIFRSLPEGRERTLILVLYVTGVRISEAVALRWEDLVAKDGGGGYLRVQCGKGNKSRVIAVPSWAWEQIMSQKPRNASPGDPVFKSNRRKALSVKRARVVVGAAAERAGLSKRVTAHWYRHANASMSLQRGCPLAVVRDSLGHANIATTSLYLHASPEDSSGNYLAIPPSNNDTQGNLF